MSRIFGLCKLFGTAQSQLLHSDNKDKYVLTLINYYIVQDFFKARPK